MLLRRTYRLVVLAMLIAVGVAGWNEPRRGIGWELRGAVHRVVPRIEHASDQVRSSRNQFGEASRALNRCPLDGFARATGGLAPAGARKTVRTWGVDGAG